MKTAGIYLFHEQFHVITSEGVCEDFGIDRTIRRFARIVSKHEQLSTVCLNELQKTSTAALVELALAEVKYFVAIKRDGSIIFGCDPGIC